MCVCVCVWGACFLVNHILWFRVDSGFRDRNGTLTRPIVRLSTCGTEQNVVCSGQWRVLKPRKGGRRSLLSAFLLFGPRPRLSLSLSQKRDAFLAVWPALVDELVAYLEGEHMPHEAVQWFKRVSP